MKNIAILIAFGSLLLNCNMYASKKEQLSSEFAGLRNALVEAQNAVKNTNYAITRVKADLENTVAWGIEQERLKNIYYEEKEIVQLQVGNLERELKAEKQLSSEYKLKYEEVQTAIAIIAGTATLLLYIVFGSSLLARLVSIAGPGWGFLVQLAAPVGAFYLGYFAAKIYF